MMKKTLFASLLLVSGFCQVANAGYVSHLFIDINVEQSECFNAGIEAAKSIGVNTTRFTEQKTVAYGMNSEGYVFGNR
jgi:hypothetical protein